MKEYARFILIPAMISVLFLLPAFSQEDMTVIEDGGFSKRQRPPAVFNHEAHNDDAGIEECNECHHVFDKSGNRVEDESSEDQRCSDCHALESKERQPGLMKAFHVNCKGCHLEKKKGPILCGECHVR